MDVTGEIVTIGNELLSGSQVDTNGPYLAGRLRSRGVVVGRLTSVGDESEAIQQALAESMRRSQVVLITGGLGPTSDDITAEAASRLFNRPLQLHEQAWQHLGDLLDRYGLVMTEGQKKQALLPEAAEMIPNPLGTAPGFLIREDDRLLFFLPGVPREMKAMVEQTVLPRLEQEWSERPCYRSRTLKLFGISEAGVDELLSDLFQTAEVQIAFLPHLPELRVGLLAQGSTAQEAEAKLARWERLVQDRLNPYVFGVDNETMETVVGMLMRRAGATIAVAESCTGGLIGHRLTNVPGSSDYVERIVVAYSNRTKLEVLKVPAEIIQTHGAVSKPAARSMAEGIRALAGTTIGLAATGIAGPGGGTPDKPVGTVYIALADATETWAKRYQFPGDRLQVKMITAQVALNRVRRYLLRRGREDECWNNGILGSGRMT